MVRKPTEPIASPSPWRRRTGYSAMAIAGHASAPTNWKKRAKDDPVLVRRDLREVVRGAEDRGRQRDADQLRDRCDEECQPCGDGDPSVRVHGLLSVWREGQSGLPRSRTVAGRCSSAEVLDGLKSFARDRLGSARPPSPAPNCSRRPSRRPRSRFPIRGQSLFDPAARRVGAVSLSLRHRMTGTPQRSSACCRSAARCLRSST